MSKYDNLEPNTNSVPRQIIATSFSLDVYFYSDVKRFFDYISEVMDPSKEKVNFCYIGTDNDDDHKQIKLFEWLLWWFKPKWNMTILKKNDIISDEKTDIVFTSDVIFISGGNTAMMNDFFKHSDFNLKLRSAYENGVLMTGVGAGLLCWFDKCITDSFGDLDVLDLNLNFLPFSVNAHHNLTDRRKVFIDAIKNGKISAGYGVPDGSIIHFVDESLEKCINSSRNKIEYITNN
jgi:hypothetical protein